MPDPAAHGPHPNVLLSFARLNFADPALLTAVADHVLANRVVEAMTPQPWTAALAGGRREEGI